MSLVYWLPMTDGELHNQGLSDAIPINHGAVVNTNGKLGKCYSFDGTTSQYIDSGFKENFGLGDFSIAAWFKLTDSDTRTYQPIISNKTAGAVSVGCAIYYNHNMGSGNFLWSTADGSGATEVWAVANSAWAYSNIINTWHHIVMVRNISDPKVGYFYFDGVRYELTSVPPVRNITNTSYSMLVGGIVNPNANYAWTGSLNDIRIYDHALSPLEVKHLAQGLVLHYPLSDAYIESTTNLITTDDCLSSTCYNAATSKYGYGTNTDIYKTVTTYNGRKGTKVYMGTSGNNCYPYVYVNNMYTSDGSNSPAYKTLSFDYYGTIGNYLGPYKLGSGEGTATYTVTCQGVKTTGTYSNFGGFTVTPNKWNHIEITFHGTTAADSQWGYIRIGNGNHTSDTSNFWFFANMQLEAKDHATGYTGVGGTRTVATVYDTSGFCNNGELYAHDTEGSITVESDTPRYNVSTHIASTNTTTSTATGTRYIYGHCSLTNPTEMTVAFWVKPINGGYGDTSTAGQGIFCTTNYEYGSNSSGQDYQASAMNHRDGAVDINDSTSTTQCRPTLWTTLNEWHHYVITYDGQVGRIYKDGVQSSTAQFSSPKTLDSFIGVIIGFSGAGGVWRSNDAYYSDFRIYATALSADDVMALYKNAGYVDSDGNVYAYEMTE